MNSRLMIILADQQCKTADQLTISQPREADYAHHFTTGTPGFSDHPVYDHAKYEISVYVVFLEVQCSATIGHL